ncbi:unnamed protein product [Knipowitschia caucasica]
MSTEQADMELKQADKDPSFSVDTTTTTGLDLAENQPEQEASETALLSSHQDPEKEPITAGEQEPTAAEGGEQNGVVKLKIPEEDTPEPEHFTGLNKEELLRVAGTPGWVRARWSLLVLFWLAWLGMLAGAVLLILKAPPCKELPPQNWWNDGPLFHIRNIQDFSPTANIKGVEQQLESLSQMKVQGLVLAPVHQAPADDPMALSFEEVSAEVGSLDQMRSLLTTAHKRGLFVVLDLSPNYAGSSGSWFSNSSVSSVAERLKSALVFWLTLGVDGVKLDSVDSVWSMVPSQWSDIRAIVQNWTDSRPHKRLLLGSSSLSSPAEVSSLLGDSGVDLLLSPVLGPRTDATERAQSILLLSSAHSPSQLLWSLQPEESAMEQDCNTMDLMLLLSLPGTALINQGQFQRIQDLEQNQTQEMPRPQPSCPLFLSSLSALRRKERSLLFGDLSLLYNSSSVLVFLRSWDQNQRFMVLFNYSPDQSFSLSQLEGPPGARGSVVLSSNISAMSPDTQLELREGQLGPELSVMLRLEQS